MGVAELLCELFLCPVRVTTDESLDKVLIIGLNQPLSSTPMRAGLDGARLAVEGLQASDGRVPTSNLSASSTAVSASFFQAAMAATQVDRERSCHDGGRSRPPDRRNERVL